MARYHAKSIRINVIDEFQIQLAVGRKNCINLLYNTPAPALPAVKILQTIYRQSPPYLAKSHERISGVK